jgi:hypothetical protein
VKNDTVERIGSHIITCPGDAVGLLLFPFDGFEGACGENCNKSFSCSSWFFWFQTSRCFAREQCRCCGMSLYSSGLGLWGFSSLFFSFSLLVVSTAFPCMEFVLLATMYESPDYPYLNNLM